MLDQQTRKKKKDKMEKLVKCENLMRRKLDVSGRF